MGSGLGTGSLAAAPERAAPSLRRAAAVMGEAGARVEAQLVAHLDAHVAQQRVLHHERR